MAPSSVLSLAILFASVVLTSGVVSAQPQPQQQKAPTPPEKVEAPKAVPGTVPEATGVGVDPNSYVLGAEDMIYINVWREPDITRMAGIRPDGKITMPLIGDLQASGLTPERLAVQLKQAYGELINKPDITVTVVQVNSKKYTITGGVGRAGVYPMPVPMKVFDALSQAGGFKDFANKKRIIIMRGAKRIKFNYNDILHGKKLDTNIFLEPGDIIIVPE